MSLNELKDIQFVNTDIRKIEESILITYEGLTGKKLFKGDPVRLFLQSVAAIIAQQKILIDYSAKQNLLKYATGQNLDHVVALVGVKRLSASAARTTLKFVISEPQQGVIRIPKGTRVRAETLYFTTLEDKEVLVGEMTKEVVAECMESGEKGNGLLPGQITELVDVFPFYQEVINITETTGGSNVESDEALRQRAYEAPNAYSTAGSDSAYAFWAKTASSEIKDVAVISPSPGKVQIIPIGSSGKQLSEEILKEVLDKCSQKNVKPLTDQVEVIQPTLVPYEIELEYVIGKDKTISSSIVQENINKSVEKYTMWQSEKLGRDINPSELMYRIMQAGAKRVNIIKPIFAKIQPTQLAKVTTVGVRYGGIEDE